MPLTFFINIFPQLLGDGLGLNVLIWEGKHRFLLSADYKNPFIVFNEELCNIQGYSNWPAAIHQRSQTETSFKIQYEIFFS